MLQLAHIFVLIYFNLLLAALELHIYEVKLRPTLNTAFISQYISKIIVTCFLQVHEQVIPGSDRRRY